MPVVHAADAVIHELHGSVFTSYAAPATGSRELCAWRLEVPGGTTGVPHAVSREEVLFVLSGTLQVTLSDGAGHDEAGSLGGSAGSGGVAGSAGSGGLAAEKSSDAEPGDAIVVPAGAVLRIDNPGAEQASAWVTTSVGLEAVLPDGSRIRPPWVR